MMAMNIKLEKQQSYNSFLLGHLEKLCEYSLKGLILAKHI